MQINMKNKKILFNLFLILLLFLLSSIIFGCSSRNTNKLPSKTNQEFYSVIYIYNNGTNDEYEDYGHAAGEFIKKPIIVDNIIYKNHIFLGWFTLDEKKWDFDSISNIMPKNNLILNARWKYDDNESNSFSVTYNFNDGTSPNYLDKNKYKGGEIITPPKIIEAPYNNGRAFLGWFDEDVRDNISSNWIFEKSTMPFHDLVLIAHWGSAKYSVTYDFADDGKTKTIVDEEHYEGSTLVYREDTAHPKREGFDFSGWYDDLDNVKTPWVFGENGDKMPGHNLVLRAHWIQDTFTVTYKFYSPLGTIIDKNLYKFKSTITELEAVKYPIKEGYTFGGWFDENLSDGKTDKWNFFVDTMPNHDLILYANWIEKTFTVTYVANGIQVATDSTNYKYGDHINYHEDYNREGWTFLGWYDYNENDLDPVTKEPIKWDFNVNKMPRHDLVLEAKLFYKLSVTYISRGITTSTEEHKYNFNDRIQYHEDLKQEGWQFDGWFDDDIRDGILNKWDYNVNKMPNHDLILIAHWEKMYRVTYQDNVIGYVSDNEYYLPGSKITPQQKKEKEGWEFLGWLNKNKDDNMENHYWDFNNDKMPNHNLILTADWVKKYHVFYIVEGSTVDNDTKTYKPGDIIDNHSDPTLREDQKFFYWYDNDPRDADKGYVNVKWDFNNFKMPDHDLRLVAKIKIHHTVTYVNMLGTAENNDTIWQDENNRLYFEGDTIVAPTKNLVNDMYTFMGWQDLYQEDNFLKDPNNPNIDKPDRVWIFGDGGDKMPDHNLILVAYWVPKHGVH